MKRIVFIILLSVIYANVSSAQTVYRQDSDGLFESTGRTSVHLVPLMKYKELKSIYNYKDYTPHLYDRYSPGWSGVASWFIPGLGQMICDEVGRGFAWFGGSLASYMLLGVGGIFSGSADYYGSAELSNVGSAIAMVGLAAMIAIDVCAIVDAVRVAKVKNMYEHDIRRQYSFDMKLHPSVSYIQSANGTQPTAGLTLAMRF